MGSIQGRREVQSHCRRRQQPQATDQRWVRLFDHCIDQSAVSEHTLLHQARPTLQHLCQPATPPLPRSDRRAPALADARSDIYTAARNNTSHHYRRLSQPVLLGLVWPAQQRLYFETERHARVASFGRPSRGACIRL